MNDVMKCANCGLEVEPHESGLCDSCEMQKSYDRVSLDLELDADDLRFVAENLAFLAGVDEGENTDRDRLLEVVGRIMTALEGEVDKGEAS